MFDASIACLNWWNQNKNIKGEMEVYFQNCGKEIDDKAEICIGCGVRVKNVSVEKKKSRTAEMNKCNK